MGGKSCFVKDFFVLMDNYGIVHVMFLFFIVNNNKELRIRNKLLVYFGIILGLFETIDSSSDSSYDLKWF